MTVMIIYFDCSCAGELLLTDTTLELFPVGVIHMSGHVEFQLVQLLERFATHKTLVRSDVTVCVRVSPQTVETRESLVTHLKKCTVDQTCSQQSASGHKTFQCSGS